MNNTIGIHYEMPDGVIAYVTGWDSRKKTITYHCDAENSGGTIPEEEWHTWKPREDLKDFPNARDPRLPYTFDLHWDIKHMSQLASVVAAAVSSGENIDAIKAAMRDHNIVIESIVDNRTNTNCLEGLKCPQCGNDSRLMIEGVSVFEVHDDGTESHGDVEWDDDAVTQCPECHLAAGLKRFHITETPKEKTYEVVAFVTKRYTTTIKAVSSDVAHRAAGDRLTSNGIDIEDMWDEDNEYYETSIAATPEEIKDADS